MSIWIKNMKSWNLNDIHKVYGKVVMMRTIDGEPYRFFIDKHRVISMIPLSTLLLEDMEAANARLT